MSAATGQPTRHRRPGPHNARKARKHNQRHRRQRRRAHRGRPGVLGGLFPEAPPLSSTGKERSPISEEVEPYSEHPSELEPHYICPPPTKTRASCEAIGVPNPKKLRARGLPAPSYEGSGARHGFSPADLRSAYNLPEEGGKGVLVAITIAYDVPNAAADLAKYREFYELPSCTEASGCFTKVNQEGEAGNYPAANAGWAEEASLDLDMVSATCPECHILLVEANGSSDTNLYAAVEEAAEYETPGGEQAAVISDSWALIGGEPSNETELDHHFDHPGIPVLFSSGDEGYGVEYPAASPDVIAVGGTSLKKDEESSRGWKETAWSGAGSGCSKYEEKPAWQKDEGCSKRTVADVSAVADIATPVSIYDSEVGGWELVGGTSVAAPLMAGVEALSSSAFREAGPSAFSRAGQSAQLFDPIGGENTYSFCFSYLCQAEHGYDGPTGWGTPDGPLSLPVAVTEAASVASTSEATLHGSVDPGGEEAEYRFEYGETTAYGQSTPLSGVGPGSEYLEVSSSLEGLEGDTPYHYRITATIGEETFHGTDHTFVTTPPTVTTDAPSEIHANDAALAATIDPEGGKTYYYFEYGVTTSYGRKTPTGSKGTVSGSEEVEVTAEAPVLSGSTTYHVRIVAENAAGTVYGNDETFTTPESEWAAERVVPSSPDPHNGKFSNMLTGVSCSSPDDCMAVGDFNAGWLEQADSEHWNGDEWQPEEMALPENAVKAVVHAVSCPAHDSCVAVGYARFEALDTETELEDMPVIERWNGSAWSAETVPAPDGIHEPGFIVEGGVEGWWETAVLRGVSCVSQDACVAVGSSFHHGGQARPLALRWDGEEWSFMPAMPDPNSKKQLMEARGVSCVTPAWCMAVGGIGSTQPVAEIWNGDEWSVVKSESSAPLHEQVQMMGVSCVAVDMCSAVQWDGYAGYAGLQGEKHPSPVERWNGKEWIGESLPEPGGTEYVRPQSISCTAVDACAVVGEAAARAGFAPAAFAWNGSEWSAQSTDEPVQAEESSLYYFVGGGHLYSWGGLRSVSCASPSICVGVGTDWELQEGLPYSGLAEIYRAPGPVSTTEPASGIKVFAATANATVNPAGSDTTYQFEYGETRAYGQTAPASAEDIGAGSEDVGVEARLKGLEAATTYHFRVVATNSDGTTYGEDKTFTTHALPPSFVSSFGEYGSGEGQLRLSLGLAADSEGNLWAADSGNSRIEEFDPEGSLLREFGGEGTGAGEFGPGFPTGASPYAVAIDAEGDVWAADTNNNRIQEFDAEGKFIKAFGWGVADGESPELQVCTTTCFGGIAGSGEGQLDRPEGLAFDSAGHLWAMSTGGQRVVEFNRQGEYLTQFEVGGSGYGDIAVDSGDNLWVVSYENNCVREFNPEGELLLEFGEEGTGDGQFEYPIGITVDSSDNLWVADSENNRVQEFNPEGKYLAQLGEKGTGDGQFKFPGKVAFDPEGDLWIADSGNGRIQKWSYGPAALTGSASGVGTRRATLNATINPQNLETTYQFEYGRSSSYGSKAPASAQSLGAGRDDVSVSKTVKGLGRGATYHFRVVATNSDGTTYGEDKTFTTHPLPPSFVSSFGEHGGEEGELSEPFGLAADSAGNLWAADSGNSRIEEFDPEGSLLREFGGEGTGAGEFGPDSPYAVAIDAEGDVWAADTNNNRIQEFDAEGKFIKAFGWGVADGESPELQVCTTTCFGGIAGSGEGQLDHPEGLAFDSAGHLWAMNATSHRVVEFNRQGEYLTQFDAGGGSDIAVDSGDNLWIVRTTAKVEKFNPEGELLLEFGEEGTGDGQLYYPTGITVDSEDNLWVADSENDRVQEFNPEGEYLTRFGEEGTGDGQFEFPRKVAFDPEGDLWVADSANSRIQKWSYWPSAVTKGPTEIEIDGESGRVTLNGTVNPNGEAGTTYQFEYGKTTAYGSAIPATPRKVGPGTSDIAVEEIPAELPFGATYHYRVVASNETGTTYGDDETLKVLNMSKATTELARAVDTEQATLEGTVNPEGSPTSYWFEYDTSAYQKGKGPHGTKLPTTPKEVGSGTSDIAVNELVTGLRPETIYHFRVVAESEAGTTFGGDRSFFTGLPPQFEAEEYPATISGEQEAEKEFVFGTNEKALSLECSGVHLDGGGATKSTTSLSLGAEYEGCELGGGLGEATVSMNSCHYTLGLEPGESPYVAVFGVACEEEGDQITITASECTVKIGAQEASGTLSAVGEGSGSGRTVSAEGTAGIAFTTTGGLCGFAGIPKEGTGSAEVGATLAAYGEESKSQVGLFIVAVPPPPRFEAEEYPVTISGEQEAEKEFVFGTSEESLSLECSGVYLDGGGATKSTTSLSLGAEYEGCYLVGLSAATVSMNSCRYTLGLEPGESPYVAAFGVACEKEGDYIEIAASGCTVKIGAQEASGTLSAAGAGTGKERTVSAEGTAGVSFTSTGFICGFAGIPKEGTGSAEVGATLAAYGEESESQVGLFIVTIPPRFEAEEYPATISGEQEAEKEFVFGTNEKALSLECSGVHLDGGGVTEPTTSLSLGAEYEGCELGGGLGEATVSMNSCRYTLGLESGEPPYAVFGVACEEEGDQITITASECTVKIGAQEASGTLSAVGEGSGSGRTVSAEGTAGIAFTTTGGLCGFAGIPKEGTGSAEVGATLAAYGEESKSQVGLFIAG